MSTEKQRKRWAEQKRRHKEEPHVTIACAGCGRTQTLRASKVIRCDGYSCGSWGGCKKNPEWQTPKRPDEDHVVHWVFQAAAGFDGWRIELATPKDQAAVARAIAIRDIFVGEDEATISEMIQ